MVVKEKLKHQKWKRMLVFIWRKRYWTFGIHRDSVIERSSVFKNGKDWAFICFLVRVSFFGSQGNPERIWRTKKTSHGEFSERVTMIVSFMRSSNKEFEVENICAGFLIVGLIFKFRGFCNTTGIVNIILKEVRLRKTDRWLKSLYCLCRKDLPLVRVAKSSGPCADLSTVWTVFKEWSNFW